MKLTERDKRWIRAVYKFRVTTTDQMMVICGDESRSSVNARLRRLWGEDYLARPEEFMRKHYSHAEKRHTLHMLGQEGANHLDKVEGVQLPQKKGWTAAAKNFKGQNVEHDLGVVDFVLALEADAARMPGVEVVHQLELLARNNLPLIGKLGRLPTKAIRKGSLVDRATDPDYTFEIHKQQDNGRTAKGLCFLEYDNDTEDFIKSDALASSIKQKHEAYTYAYQRKLHTKLYDRDNFRVLFVVNDTLARVKKMQQVYKDTVAKRIAAGVFLYTTVEAVRLHGVFGDIWTNGAGERVEL
ncbi:replication-relaxation family protein [uncultured Roseobacter sp.]|uniref:replication-relaxation family protein n=1 Tax=uncultured Roseobacter sp. TaxID=114847 RepID=UPI0026225C58|nr:replication-relaxation family protein [uncultured Roseobacter sp.]